MTDLLIGTSSLSLEDAISCLGDFGRNNWATVRWYDLNGSDAVAAEPTPGVTMEDLGRMLFLNPGLTGDDAANLVRTGEIAPWGKVRLDARLEDADPEKENGLYDAAEELHGHFTAINGVGHGKASKLLRLKRPFLYPVLDENVRRTYEDAAFEAANRSGQDQKRMYWAAIRHDLLRLHDDGAFDEVKKRLSEAEDESVRLLASLPELRLLDILAWQLGRPRP